MPLGQTGIVLFETTYNGFASSSLKRGCFKAVFVGCEADGPDSAVYER